MDLRRRAVRGGDAAHVVLVPGLAIGQRAQAHRLAAFRQVLVAHEVVQPPVRREDLRLDHRAVGAREPCPIGSGEIGGHVPDRPPVQRVLRLRHDLRLELRQDALGQHARQRVTLRHALAHVDDGLVGPGDEPVDALQEVLVVLDRLERLDPAARAELHEAVRHRVELVERDEPRGIAETLDLDLAAGLEDVVRDQVLPAELARVHRRDPLQEPLLQAFSPQTPVGRDLHLVAVVEARVADRGGEQWVEPQVLLEILVEDLVQLLRLGSTRVRVWTRGGPSGRCSGRAGRRLGAGRGR